MPYFSRFRIEVKVITCALKADVSSLCDPIERQHCSTLHSVSRYCPLAGRRQRPCYFQRANPGQHLKEGPMLLGLRGLGIHPYQRRFQLARFDNTITDSSLNSEDDLRPQIVMQAAQSAHPSGYFDRLPIEINQKILSSVSRVYSLRAAALSCRTLYLCFTGAEKAITTEVLREEIPFPVFKDAVMLLDSHSVDSLDLAMVRNFIEKHYNRGWTVGKRQFSLSQAFGMSTIHELIDYFTDEFVIECASKANSERIRPSESELMRIQRTFYRYEIFCNIFRQRPPQPHEFLGETLERFQYRWALRIEDRYMAKFAPWENEQLACVYTFLLNKATPMYNDIAEHDIEWALGLPEWGDEIFNETCGHFQYFAATGLLNLCRLINSSTYAKRRNILSRRPNCRMDFITSACRRVNGWDPYGDELPDYLLPGPDPAVYLATFTPEEEEKYVKPAFFRDDDDTGPEETWRWAHQDSKPREFVFGKWQRELREWGYVMWDQARLDRSETMLSRNTAFQPSRELYRKVTYRINRRMLIDTSCYHRVSIHMNGGRGWWAPRDFSRVVWGFPPEIPWVHEALNLRPSGAED